MILKVKAESMKTIQQSSAESFPVVVAQSYRIYLCRE